jgi:PAS domain-containing protein
MTMLSVLNSWVAMLALLGAVDQARVDRLVEASVQLEKGDDESKVIAVLGRATTRWEHPTLLTLLAAQPSRQWAYGTFLDLSDVWATDSILRNLLPIKFRMFGPNESDLVIVWDADGRIAWINRP